MTLTAPAHLRTHGRRQPLAPEFHAERRDWIIAQAAAGHSTRAIAEALRTGTSLIEVVQCAARKDGILPPFVRQRSMRLLEVQPRLAEETPPPLEDRHDPTKRIVTFDSRDGRSVSLPRLPFETASGCIDDPRHETTPRQTLVRAHPSERRRVDIAAVIAAIRQEKEARA